MSTYQFFASDFPIQEKTNSSIQLLSIEECQVRGLELPNWYHEDTNINRKDKIVLYAPNEDCFDDIVIRVEDYPVEAKKHSQKQYFASLEWRYSESRAQELVLFIKEHLKKASELEVWHTWINKYDMPTVKRINVKELAISTLQETIGLNYYDQPICLIIEK